MFRTIPAFRSILVALLVAAGGTIAAAQDQPQPSPQQHFEAGRNPEALQAIAQRRERGEAGDADAYLASQILLKTGQNDEARGEFQRLAASGTEAWRLIGESGIATLEGNNQRAVETATAASNAAPEMFEAHYQLGYVKARAEDWEGSSVALERATQLNPTFAYAHYNAGQAFSRLQRADRAAEHFERFLKLAPEAPERAAVESLMRTIRGR